MELGRKLNEEFIKLDSVTYNHSIRVMSIAKEIEEYYHFRDNRLSAAGLIHDIGKIYVSTKILDKKGSLSKLEKDLMSLHPYIGYDILKRYNVDEDICRMVLYHHGPKPMTLHKLPYYDNDEVMDLAVLLHSIDSYEALTSDRSYHRGYLANEALDIMLTEEGHHPMFIDYVMHVTQKPSFESDSKIFRNHCNIDNKFVKTVVRTLLGSHKSFVSI